MSKQSEAMKLVRGRLASMNHEDSIFAGEFNEEIKLLDEVIEQPAQPWVDLTVTEQNELCRELGASRHQVRAIGAKLKEKNTKGGAS